jgi:hypothetical protein
LIVAGKLAGFIVGVPSSTVLAGIRPLEMQAAPGAELPRVNPVDIGLESRSSASRRVVRESVLGTSGGYMSAVLAAVYDSHESAEQVRIRLVNDGFPTDRVELTSRQELGQAKLVPAADLEDKLTQYFQQLFPDTRGDVPVNQLQSAIRAGQAVIAVHPRGQIETDRAIQILNVAGPMQIEARDLDKQSMEHAAADQESSALSWIGRVMVAPQVRDR